MRVAAAVEGLQRDLAAGRVAAVCAAMTDRAQRQVGSVGHGRKPTTCERDLREFVTNMRETAEAYGEVNDLARARRPRIEAIVVADGGAAARVAFVLPGGDPYDVPLVRQGGIWKLDDFFGAVGPAPRALR